MRAFPAPPKESIMKRNALASLVLALVMLAITSGAFAAPLRAGAGKVEISLGPGMALAGYGTRINKPHQGVHDPVFARAVIFESGGKRAAVVSADILLVTRELHEEVAQRVADLHLDLLAICATHTHYSVGSYVDNRLAEIAVMGKYDPQAFELVASAITQALEEAASSERPARAGGAWAPAPGVAYNRRHKGGPTDPRVRVLGVFDEEGELLALFVNHAVHPTSMPDQTRMVSGDMVGSAMAAIEEKFPGAVALFLNAGEGDQAPDSSWQKASWDNVDKLGLAMAESAFSAFKEIRHEQDIEITLYKKEFDMPEVQPRRWPPCFLGLNALFPYLGKGMIREKGEIMAIKIGDTAMVFSPAEISYEIQHDIEMMLPDSNVLVTAQANDYYGYVVTPKDYRSGGYETCMSFYGPDFGDYLTGQYEIMLKDNPAK